MSKPIHSYTVYFRDDRPAQTIKADYRVPGFLPEYVQDSDKECSVCFKLSNPGGPDTVVANILYDEIDRIEQDGKIVHQHTAPKLAKV